MDSAAQQQHDQGRQGHTRHVGGAADFRRQLEIAAPVEAVYGAITTREGIGGWWTDDADVPAAVGETIQVRFGGAGWTDLRVDRLERPRLVEWTCVGQDIAGFTPRDEWVGTRIGFALSEAGDDTLLDFVHHGLRALDCIQICDDGWSRHLAELKVLVE